MIHDLFSKRQKRSRGEVFDVYQYTDIPRELRVQVVHLLKDLYPISSFEKPRDILCREYGVFFLWKKDVTPYEDVCNFLITVEDADRAIDVIEIAFQPLDVRGDSLYLPRVLLEDAIAELNARFQEHGVGYQFESGKIIRIDSQYIHSEVVQPVLNVLSGALYKGANEEFLSAHEHYRHGRYKDCLNECFKSFESCMKSICKSRGWKYTEKDTASRLIQILFDHDLIPLFMQAHFTSLKSTLEAGVPTIRNKRSGHGQGPEKFSVPESLSAYALHLTASNILFLARANDELGRSGR